MNARDRSGWLLLLACTAAGCGGGGGPRAGSAVAALGSASSAAATSSRQPAVPLPAAPAARVAITPRGISVDGRTRFLYGGEVQYFRIRDPQGSSARTHAMWAAALDRVASAGMNLVTTYAPWDVHEPAEGAFDFSGAADLERFLELCHQRGLLVLLKPGPFINAEWPWGMGAYGGVPEWFKAKYPGSLARRPDGARLNTDPLGRPFGVQPSYFAPELLQHTERWFARLAPIVERFVRREPTIFAIQLDNETNFYFGDRYGSDYSVHGLRQYRDFLRARYGTIAALNRAYGRGYGDFDDVQPPRARPDRGASPAENLRHQDWFDAGHAGIQAFQLALRAAWERLGVREPDVLFTTNDSPHTFPGRDLLLWRGEVKRAAGLPLLDAYPKQLPISGDRPFDYPFLTPLFSQRFAASGDRYAFAGGAPLATGRCYAAELEGGLFSLPIVQVQLPVPLETTDLTLLQHVGRGSALASVYVLHAGRNRDGSPYFSNAALGIDGQVQPRWEVLRRWGGLLQAHGDELLAADALPGRVALLVDERFDAPAGGVLGHPGRIQVEEAAGAFGWLEDAGLEPQVVELAQVRPGDLDRFDVAVYPNPDVVHEDAAALLDDWVRRGGTLVNLLHTGRHDQAWRRGTSSERLLAQGLLGDGVPGRSWENLPLLAGGINLHLPQGPDGALAIGPFLQMYQLAGGATPLVRERTAPFGFDGDVVGWLARRGAGTVVHLGTNPGWLWSGWGWYDADAAELLRARGLARWLAGRGGVGPVVSVESAAGTAWARRVPGGATFLFLQHRRGQRGRVRVELHDAAALGVLPGRRYDVEDVLGGRLRRSGVPGDDLARAGLELELPAYGAAVLRLR